MRLYWIILFLAAFVVACHGGNTLPPTPITAITAQTSTGSSTIPAIQIFDETNNGYVISSAAYNDGGRYRAIWGGRANLPPPYWRHNNPGQYTGWYTTMETDASPTTFGAVGHKLSWWEANHPSWILYTCSVSNNAPTHILASIPSVDSIPLDIHNPSVARYQADTMVYAVKKYGYTAASVDEATFWFAGGSRSYYPCGIWSGSTFIRRYNGPHDPNWTTDVLAWAKTVHPILKSQGVALMVNHPANGLSTDEETWLANVDIDLDETGFIDYGRYGNGLFTKTVAWMKFAQQHGTMTMIDQNWARTTGSELNAAQLDYAVATFLSGYYGNAGVWASTAYGFGLEQWHSQYDTNVGAACGDMSGGPVYYRKFANALVVVNTGASTAMRLPSGHTYRDLFGRHISTLNANDGYVLLTTNGCQ